MFDKLSMTWGIVDVNTFTLLYIYLSRMIQFTLAIKSIDINIYMFNNVCGTVVENVDTASYR